MPGQAVDATAHATRTQWSSYQEGDFVIRNHVFRSGERLPALRLHYRTVGTTRRNAAGKIINGVPIGARLAVANA